MKQSTDNTTQHLQHRSYDVCYRRTNEIIKNRYHFIVIAVSLADAISNFKSRLTFDHKVSIQSVKMQGSI